MRRRDAPSIWAAAWADALRAMSLGWELAVPICGGVLLGHVMDRFLHTGSVATVGMLVFGVMVGFYNVGRRIHEEIERDRQEYLNRKRGEDG